MGVHRVQVYDLATKFRLTTKEVLERLQAAGIEATTFTSPVDEVAACEALSRPAARVPVRTIRPGSGLPIKPVTRRTLSARETPYQITEPNSVRQEAGVKLEPPSAKPNPAVEVTDENAAYVGRGLAILRKGLAPHVEAQLREQYGDRWWEAGVEASLKDNFGGQQWRVPDSSATDCITGLDVQSLLTIIWSQWYAVFRPKIGEVGRSYVFELRTVRNRWAHQHPFTLQEADYALGTMSRLLQLFSAREAKVIAVLSQDLRALHLKSKKLGQTAVEMP
jgi:hypothetical protein